jgi:hypothetical protein
MPGSLWGRNGVRTYLAILGAILSGLIVSAAPAVARHKGDPPASPPAKASCQFSDGKTVAIDYSSPRVRGRKIFGGLVPYGEVWILGANKATWLVTTANLTADGVEIPAGSYSLFALPNPDSWTLIINKTSRDAIGGMSYYPGKDSDLARLPLTISKLPAKQEAFTISFVPGGSSCAMRFDWDLTRASITISEKK